MIQHWESVYIVKLIFTWIQGNANHVINQIVSNTDQILISVFIVIMDMVLFQVIILANHVVLIAKVVHIIIVNVRIVYLLAFNLS